MSISYGLDFVGRVQGSKRDMAKLPEVVRQYEAHNEYERRVLAAFAVSAEKALEEGLRPLNLIW